MINCIAIDDEFLALEVITNYVTRVTGLVLTGTFTRALDALPILNGTGIDLLFLDIDMPDISGPEFIKTLKSPPLIIFTTAYSEFAMEGYEADAVDYLVKPIPFHRFLIAIQKARNRLSINEHLIAPTELFIKSDYKMLRVPVDDILFIEGKKDYVAIQMVKHQVNTSMTINALIEKLKPMNFIRVHRSFIIALNKVTSIERGNVLIGDVKIPIGDQYRDELIKRIS